MTSHYPGLDRYHDYSTQQGAAILVARIRAYWRERVITASVWAQEVPSNLDGNRTFVVRSTMQGGRP